MDNSHQLRDKTVCLDLGKPQRVPSAAARFNHDQLENRRKHDEPVQPVPGFSPVPLDTQAQVFQGKLDDEYYGECGFQVGHGINVPPRRVVVAIVNEKCQCFVMCIT